MSLEAKGTIRFDPDAKMELIMKAPTLYIEEEIKIANPQIDLPELIDLLIKRMTDKIQCDFNRPVNCTLQSYSLNLIVSVDPINNRTLDEFAQSKAVDIAVEMVSAAAEAGATVTVSTTKPGAVYR
jgi:hypothetical protein